MSVVYYIIITLFPTHAILTRDAQNPGFSLVFAQMQVFFSMIWIQKNLNAWLKQIQTLKIT